MDDKNDLENAAANGKEVVNLTEFAVLQGAGYATLVHLPSHRTTPLRPEDVAFLEPLAGRWEAEGLARGERERLEALDLVSSVKLSDDLVLLRDTLLSKKLMDATFVTTYFLIVCQQCNMACTYCNAHAGDYENPATMTLDTVRASIDFMVAHVPENLRVELVITGGEPLMHPEIVRTCIEYAEQQRPGGFKFVLVTNATLLTPEMADFLAAHNIEVTVSIDGPADIQRRNRPLKNGGDSYETVLQNISLLKERGVSPYGSATRYAEDSFEVIDQELARLGFENRSVRIVRNSSYGFNDRDDYARDAQMQIDTLDALARKLLSAVECRDAAVVREVLTHPAHGLWLAYCLREPFSAERKHISFCMAGRTAVSISAEGNIYPCTQFNEMEEYRLGSVDTDFDRSLFGLHGAVRNPKCHRCALRYCCEGFCLNQALVMAPPDCEYPPIFYLPPEHCALQQAKLGIHACFAAMLDEESSAWIQSIETAE